MAKGPLVDDERLKLVLPQACGYCVSREILSVDHLIPTKRSAAIDKILVRSLLTRLNFRLHCLPSLRPIRLQLSAACGS